MLKRLSLVAAICSIILVAGCGMLPPVTPEAPRGPTTGDVSVEYDFTAVTYDPQNLPIRFQFDWGDGHESEWSRYVPGGELVTMAHAWRTSGAYPVRVRAENLAGRQSELSPRHVIMIGAQEGYPDSVIAKIDVGYRPFGVCMLPNGEYAYVANRIGGISVISTATKFVVQTIEPPAGPALITPTPDGRYVYFTMADVDQMGVIRTSDNTVIRTVDVGEHPIGVAVSPNGERAYVANYYSGTVSVIRTSDYAVIANVAIPGYPWCVRVTPDGEFVYASGRGTDTMAVIRASTNEVVKLVNVGTEPCDIAWLPNGQYAYVSCRLDHDVAVIRREGNEVAARIPAANHPTGIAILPNGAYAYISDYLGNNVLVARTSDNTVVDTLKFGSVSDWSAVDPNRSEVYIGVPNKEQIWVVGYRH